ncbi:hypothetical protein H6P81_005837 [Aristolochia fimbriata]|uniref:Transposase, Ptta/En/Spm, plant n=1 Tax=Aristolochia fimbriata TaxID=158543 RepID=A0AAV7EVS6_ARIFI|nr:hypothetical protein H6P81_005837 [Aristolochia fimbriata]
MAPGKRPPPLPECSSSDIPEIGIEVQASTVPRKRGRGPSRGLTVEKLYEKLGHKISIEFDATSRRPKGRYNGEFIGYIGLAVRTRLPHRVRYFRNFKAEDFLEAYAFIQNYFAIDILRDNLCRDVVLRTMGDIFRTYRRELSAWFQQHGGDPKGRLTPFPDVNDTDWQWLCENIFATKSFQDRSAQNKVNISKLKVRHTAGQKSFQRLFDEMNLMLEAKEQATQQETPVNEKQIVEDVLRSRSGYIKGQGLAQPAVPKRPRGISSSSSSIQIMIDEVREEHRREIKKLKEENNRQLEEHSRQLEEMRREMIQMIQGLRDP